MRSPAWIVLLLFTLTGCQWLRELGPATADNPVMEPPPPRTKLAGHWKQAETVAAQSKTDSPKPQSNIKLVSQTSQPSAIDFTGVVRVAMVDGQPILASEILDRYSAKFKEVQGQATAEELRKIREHLVKRDLKIHVERALLVNALRRSLPKEGREQLEKLINDAFEKEIVTFKTELKVDSKVDLEKKLNETGTTLTNIRDAFANQQMAAYYFNSKVKPQKVIGRPDLLRYYEKHLADYAVPARVRWQEIQVGFDKHHGKDNASKETDRIIARLKAGDDFAELAKKRSDGLTAAKGGYWDWTQSGSLTDEKLDRALFELPVGRIQVNEEKTCFRLVRVTERQKARWKPFSEVQTGIRDILEKEEKARIAKRVIGELMRNAVITTIFDGDPTFKPEWRANVEARNAIDEGMTKSE
jgi:PPIC-type PPIASE domain